MNNKVLKKAKKNITQKTLLKLAGVTKKFNEKDEKPAVDNINLKIREVDLFVLV